MSAATGEATAARRAAPPARLPLVLAAAVVLLQVAYPLLDGTALHRLTVVTVVVFCLASVSHAALALGAAAAGRLLLVAGGTSLLAEAVGVATGVPFGEYAYAGTLGPQLLGVPLVVPLAWTMMAYPTLVAARAVTAGAPPHRRRLLTAPLAALGLTAWDLFLDPQMVGQGHWTWAHPDPHLPGMDGIPLTNLAGWLLVSLLVQALLDRTLPEPALPGSGSGSGERQLSPVGPGAVALLLGWTWLGSAVAATFFFDRPAVGAWVLVAMAPLVLPALLRWYPGLVSRRHRAPRPR